MGRKVDVLGYEEVRITNTRPFRERSKLKRVKSGSPSCENLKYINLSILYIIDPETIVRAQRLSLTKTSRSVWVTEKVMDLFVQIKDIRRYT